jgi:DNA repair exonuclease SbcCD ATPase subunit
MKFTLKTPESSHGIRVIGSLPDEPLCRVEGLNGVGKTLAIHLLEICTGQQPYATRSQAWRTLCQYLGPAEVVIDGLKAEQLAPEGGGDEAHSLRFAFDWRNRDDESAPRDITVELFDEITLDGVSVADMQEVRQWLRVVRVAGDQRLADTIADIVSYDQELLRAAAGIAHNRRDHSDHVVAEMLRPFSLEDAQRALETAREARTLAQRRGELEQGRKRQHARLELLELAHGAHAAVADVTANADTLSGEIRGLRTQLETARARTAEAERELEAAREDERLSSDAEKELKSAERTFSRRLGARKKAEQGAEELAATLGIVPRLEEVNSALDDVERARSEASEGRAELQDMFALRDLLDGLVQALAPAAAGGLRARAIATLGDRTVTAGELLDGIRKRRERLATDAPAVEELDAQLAELEQREGQLEKLKDLIADREKKREVLAEAEQVLEALGNGNRPSGDSVAEKSAARAAAQRVEIELGGALGSAERQLAQLGGGLSLEDLQAELDRRLTEAQTTVAELEVDLRQARGQLVALDDELDAAAARYDELDGLKSELGRTLVDRTRALTTEEAHARLRSVLGDRMPDPAHDCEELAQAWIEVHRAGDRAVQRLQGARGDLDRLAGEMRELVDAINHGDKPSPELDRVRALYQERMLREFSQPELLGALFDGGELTRIDLSTREVVWQTAAGEPRVRPFEAFSSGERAFAYVQAQLASVADQNSANKVVAVDEFGAFLSRDRLIRLQKVVQLQLRDRVIDQAIVILPLSRPEGMDDVGDSGYVTGPFDELAVV